jgi:hypothetical protein
MPLEVRELLVKVDVGSTPRPAARRLDQAERAALKREIIEACLAELRQRMAAHGER